MSVVIIVISQSYVMGHFETNDITWDDKSRQIFP